MDNSLPSRAASDPSTASAQKSVLALIWDPRVFRVLCTGLIFYLVLEFFHHARETLTLFLFAILFAYFLAPVVGYLQPRLHGRGRSVAAVYLLLGLLIAGLGFAVGPTIATESKQLVTSIPALLDRIGSGQIVTQFGHTHSWTGDRINQVQGLLVQHRTQILGYGSSLAEHLASPVQHIWWLVIIPILSLFFLMEGESIASGVVQFGRSADERKMLDGLLYDVNVMLGSYIRAQIILATLTLVAYTLVLSLMRVPYAFILGPLAGFLEFIPVVGPAVGAVAIFAIAILAGYPHAVWLVIFLGCWRLTQDYVSAPRIMGKSLEINPLTQIFAVLAGGEIAGVVGALISVPVVAMLRIVWRRVRDEHEDSTPVVAVRQLRVSESPAGEIAAE